MLQAWTRPLLYPEEVLLPTWSLQRAECEPLRPRPWDAQDWQLCWRSRDEIRKAQSIVSPAQLREVLANRSHRFYAVKRVPRGAEGHPVVVAIRALARTRTK